MNEHQTTKQQDGNQPLQLQDITSGIQILPSKASSPLNELSQQKKQAGKTTRSGGYNKMIQLFKESSTMKNSTTEDFGSTKLKPRESKMEISPIKFKFTNDAVEKRDESQNMANNNIISDFHNQLHQLMQNHLESQLSKEEKDLNKDPDEISPTINLQRKMNNNESLNIYWTKEKLLAIKHKFQAAKEVIIKREEEYFKTVNIAIGEGNIEKLRELLLDPTNQKFYKRQLQASSILKDILLKERIDILNELLKDEFYKFDDVFIFEHLGSQLKKKNTLDQKSLCTLLKNVVEYNLYKKSLIKVLGWFICSFGFYDIFRALIEKNFQEYETERAEHNNFSKDEDVMEYLENDATYYQTLIVCLKENLQTLAIELISFLKKLDDNEVIDIAVKYNSKLFLRDVWGKITKANADEEQQKKAKRGLPDKKKILTIFEKSMKESFFNKKFTVSELIIKFKEQNNQEAIHDIISKWENLEKDPELLSTLFLLKSYDEISILIYNYPNTWVFSTDQFRSVIEDGGLDLIVQFLKIRECRQVLEEKEIQKLIIQKYLGYGEKMYYGAEMMSYITKNNWDLNLTNDLLRTIDRSIKNKNILNCHSPVLTCLLLSELVANIGEISVHFQARCEKTKTELINFCKSIQEANPDEKYIKFLMTQKDSRGRSAYQIAADNEAYVVLESPEVGTIVRKMWAGRLTHDGLLAFSSLAKYMENPTGRGLGPFENFEKVDKSKTYFHQLELWTESCSLRYYPESLSTILLIVLYNLFIYFLVNEGLVMAPLDEIGRELRFMVIVYIVWVFCIVLNIPLQIFFCYLSGKRKYIMDKWGYIEICMMISALLLLLDTTMVFPVKDEFGNDIPSDGKSDNAFVLRAIILSVNDIFVWLRITGILLTYKELGPLIRMIYCLSQVTAKYLVVYALYITCCAAIFTALFYNASSQFESFSVTFTTLFGGFINNLDCFNFKFWNEFGAVMVLVYVTFSGLMLINLLIALLSNEYLRLSKGVDAAHRSVLISYFRRYKWDKNYGYLILLTTPLNIINFFLLPFNIFFKTKPVFNTFISRVYFTLLYLPIILSLQICFSILYIPFCYLIGAFWTIYDQYYHRENNFLKKIMLIFFWIFAGVPYLLLIYFRDIGHLVSMIFAKIDKDAYDLEKKRIKQFIQPDDIRNFLQFIHKRGKGDQNDLHNLFIEFLDFEHEKKAELDKDFKEKASYLQKLRTAGQGKKRFSYSLSMYSQKKTTTTKEGSAKEKEEDANTLSGRLIKRNLIIIEILENFLIDDGSDNFIVDIEKLKMLLPKTMNINSAYIKRLVHTDIATLTKAVNKLKNKANAFLQHKLLNKIVGSIIRLDKVVDIEGNRDPLQNEEDKKLNKFEIEENEDDFYTTLAELLTRISGDVSENIKTIERKIQDQENEKKQQDIFNHKLKLNRNQTKMNKESEKRILK